jgi:mannose-6-phosphate isomerase-like protein (cupin superfamily)
LASPVEAFMDVVYVAAKFAKFTEHWSPKIVAQLNDLHIKVVRIKGDFVWHKHANTDELFLVHKGVLKIGLREAGREREVRVGPGEMFVVPKGIEHITAADEECEMLLIRAGRYAQYRRCRRPADRHGRAVDLTSSPR